ncbi:acyl-coenzyme A thioesterase PaaI-like protein [Thermocatellispora tengchongensis]|uniref:Acyl-coenzyme A thioesterase THEM4 n=1 Tax=Thermocatellispora tengchongensis TaxID=1073253 RepID=A0A840PFX9_9ACTN|nr:PaaI family thioesterase [Thermocatellispora tengchongensis]MBB5136853.1 acyl-coenzyme A thioesterase PaaI-like protein [Thermocatellispora tengchongensis]
MSGAEMQAQSQFVAQVRRLVDLAVRVPPVRDSARFAAELRGIADRIESHAGDGPWFHGVRPGDRPALPAGGAGASTAGALWARFNPQAPPIVFSRVDDEVVGTVEVGPAFAGPPGRVHGGVVATLLDHAMGAYLFEIGRSSFTATLNIGYLKATPLGAPLEVRAGHDRIEGRKTSMWSTISVEGEVVARATGLFIQIAS